MKALILAAGLGTRLKPLTDSTPKALLAVGGVPMLERALLHLKEAGVKTFVVNVHHHAQRVAQFCAELSRRHHVQVCVSHEDDLLLDTGGAVKKAAALLRGREPFLVRNADVLSDLDLRAFYDAHKKSGALVTLSVRERDCARAYLFDPQGRFLGHDDRAAQRTTWAKGPVAQAQRLGFDGIHAISPEFLDKITEGGVFSITKTYVRLAGSGADIRAFRADASVWHDVGTPEKLAAAESWLNKC
ncbi:MAG: nucleotidyltransferase family protein [Elusimicrobiota bacterium]